MEAPVVGVRYFTGERGALNRPFHPADRTDFLPVPAAQGYEVPVLVPLSVHTSIWYGAQSHPDLHPACHLADLWRWHHLYGAELYYANWHAELTVTRPPRTPADIAQCTVEQLAYCYDLVQFVGVEEAVARRQAPANHWSCWWD